MKITWLEMRKAFSSPMVIVLLGLMLLWNIFLIYEQVPLKKELKTANNIVNSYGLTLNDDALALMESDLDEKLITLGFTSIEEYYNEISYERFHNGSEEDKKRIQEIDGLLMYYHYAQSLPPRYEQINIMDSKKSFYTLYDVPEWLQSYYDQQYIELEERYQEIIATEENKQVFFLNTYHMHSFLFRTIGKWLAFEGLILIALITALIMNYEFEHRTQLIVYASKHGRKLIFPKVIASFLMSLLALIILFGGTLGFYFSQFDYSSLWQTAVASGFNWEYDLPYLTWWPIRYWEYSVLALAVIGSCLLLILLITVILSIFIKNSYYVWTLCILLSLAMFVVPAYLPKGELLWLASYNLIYLLMNPHHYFAGGDSYMMEKYHELYTIIIWSIITSGSLWYAIRHFNRKDVV